MDTEITSDRLLLRQVRLEDIESIYAAEKESLDELQKWFWWCHPSHSRKKCAEWVASRQRVWAAGEEYSFLVTDRDSGVVFGCVWLNAVDRDMKTAALGYWVRTSAYGLKIATEATRLMVYWGFDQLSIMRVQILIATTNQASQRIAQKLGATQDCSEHGRISVGDLIQDAIVYSLTYEDLVRAEHACSASSSGMPGPNGFPGGTLK